MPVPQLAKLKPEVILHTMNVPVAEGLKKVEIGISHKSKEN